MIVSDWPGGRILFAPIENARCQSRIVFHIGRGGYVIARVNDDCLGKAPEGEYYSPLPKMPGVNRVLFFILVGTVSRPYSRLSFQIGLAGECNSPLRKHPVIVG